LLITGWFQLRIRA